MRRLKMAFTVATLLFMAACGVSKKTPVYSGETLVTPAPQETANPAAAAPKYDSIQVKYAGYLQVTPETIENTRLYYFIEKWLGTPYRWGGADKRGIDCSAFLQLLLAEVYTIQVPRTSVQQFLADRVDRFKSMNYLSEGDLVFFRTLKNTLISHVGLYLHNGMFINSSSSKGVSLASLNDPYWKKRYVAAGRVKPATPVKDLAGKK